MKRRVWLAVARFACKRAGGVVVRPHIPPAQTAVATTATGVAYPANFTVAWGDK